MSGADIQLLRQVLELQPGERSAFIDRHCADDATRRERLHRLIALDGEGDALLDCDVGQVAACLLGDADGSALVDRVGERLGPWRLVSQIGEGGMGSVWLAERADGAFEQTAAIKTIKPGMDSAAVLRIFQRERELLARLQHAQIAYLIDGGIDAQGRPWLAMRHVQGVALERWLEGAPTLRRRLQLFVSLCRTVAYAHRQLVLHQDIKPGNVLVESDGTPCLLDFGIGRILYGEEGTATRTMQRFISPAYAAPEQISGAVVSTATDVYALGAILFELLTGRRYSSVHTGDEKTTRPSDAMQAGHHTLPFPAAQVRGDLDAIASRALAEDPARRYGSADLLADDIERYLAGWPVTARPDGELYRISKWVQRNRLASTAMLVAVLALAVGLAISLQQTAVAQRETRRAMAVKDYLVTLFDAGRTNAAGVGVLDQRVIDMLDTSADRLKDELSHLPEVRDEIYTTLVEVYDANDRPERSLTLARERVEQAEAAFGAGDPRVAPALALLAGVYVNHDRHGDAIAPLQRAQALLDADGAHQSLTQAQVWQYRGMAMSHAGDVQAGIALLERAAGLLRARYPDSDERIVALFALCDRVPVADDPGYATALVDELRQAARAKHGQRHVYSAQAELMYALLLFDTGRQDAGLAALQQLIPVLQHYQGAWHHDVFVMRFKEVDMLRRMGRIEDALASWEQANAQRLAHAAGAGDLEAAYEDMRIALQGDRTEHQTAPVAAQ